MNTAIALAVLAALTVLLEVLALRKPDDNWWTITRVMRTFPRFAVALVMFFVGVLVGHFWWCS
jgi:hypothetical protein